MRSTPARSVARRPDRGRRAARRGRRRARHRERRGSAHALADHDQPEQRQPAQPPAGGLLRQQPALRRGRVLAGPGDAVPAQHRGHVLGRDLEALVGPPARHREQQPLERLVRQHDPLRRGRLLRQPRRGYYKTLIATFNGSTWKLASSPNRAEPGQLPVRRRLRRRDPLRRGRPVVQPDPSSKSLVLTLDGGSTWKMPRRPAPGRRRQPARRRVVRDGHHVQGGRVHGRRRRQRDEDARAVAQRQHLVDRHERGPGDGRAACCATSRARARPRASRSARPTRATPRRTSRASSRRSRPGPGRSRPARTAPGPTTTSGRCRAATRRTASRPASRRTTTLARPLIQTLAAGTWTLTSPTPYRSGTFNYLYGLSCPTIRNCKAVGDYLNVGEQPLPHLGADQQPGVGRRRLGSSRRRSCRKLHCLTTTERLTPPDPRAADAGTRRRPRARDGPRLLGRRPERGRAPTTAIYLAYRLRRPVGEGRGYAIVVARSTDGETVRDRPRDLDKDDFDCRVARAARRSPSRPTAGGGSTSAARRPGTLHWWVDALEADDPSGVRPQHADLDAARRRGHRVQGPGRSSTRTAAGTCGSACTAIEDPADADRMHTVVRDERRRPPLGPAADRARRAATGTWDQRGARVASVLMEPDHVVAYYDGRATAEQNWEEQTGLAFGREPGVAPRGRRQPGRGLARPRRRSALRRARSASPTAGSASTTRRPAPTAPTTCARSTSPPVR